MIFLFGSWFSSKKLAEATMYVCADIIGMVKINIKGFCKDTIDEIKNDFPGGSYLVLRSKPMIPWGRPLFSIGYKYNAWKVISFIATYYAGSTKSGIPYLYKYQDTFSNVAIHPVARPLVMCKFFISVNEVDSHKKIKAV